MDDNTRQKLMAIRFNPLVDYSHESKVKKVETKRKLSETSLAHLSYFPDQKDEIIVTEDRDYDQYTKLVSSAVNREIILGLKPSAIKLFIWIAYKLDYRSDVVEISYDKHLSFHFSNLAFREAIEQLEHKHIIKRIGNKRTQDYWKFHINPQYLFKGDCSNFYKDLLEVHPEYLTLSTIKIVRQTRNRKTVTS